MRLNTGKKQKLCNNSIEIEQQVPMPLHHTVISSVERDEDIFYEILKHLDAKALAMAACVNRRWRHAAEDETLWESVCTRNWPSSSSRAGQLRSVVLALGGFKRLYVLCLRPLLSRPAPAPANIPAAKNFQCGTASSTSTNREWSKDEVHLSLSLFSIDCYERLGRRYNFQQTPSLKLLCKPSLPDQFCYLVPSAPAPLSGVN